MDTEMVVHDSMSDIANVQNSGLMGTDQAKTVAEVIAKMMVAKRFPRSIQAARIKILKECQRYKFASEASYSYPRGNTTVYGPSIRMAEMIAINWGNLDYGIRELEQRDGESTVQAFAWDKETNTSREMTFQVKHQRKAAGKIKTLDDPRDIYEMTANQGARRLRACILALIPGDIVNEALDECDKALKAGEATIPLTERIKKICSAFDKFGITVLQIEKRLGHSVEQITADEITELQKIFNSIKDNVGSRKDYFEFGDQEQSTTTKDLQSAILAKK